jgi:hypothetical protein
MSRVEWLTFKGLRGDDRPRDWLRWSELWAIVQAEIPALCQWNVRQALRAGPPAESRYGHKHYTREHLEAVRNWAAARGLTKKGVD